MGPATISCIPTGAQAQSQLLRITQVEYQDGISEPAGGWDGSQRPNPREISNRLAEQEESLPNQRGLTGFAFQWGQFSDHDMDLTGEAQADRAL